MDFINLSFVDALAVPCNKVVCLFCWQPIRVGVSAARQVGLLMQDHKSRTRLHTRMGESLYQIPVERAVGVQSTEAKPKLLIRRKILLRRSGQACWCVTTLQRPPQAGWSTPAQQATQQ